MIKINQAKNPKKKKIFDKNILEWPKKKKY